MYILSTFWHTRSCGNAAERVSGTEFWSSFRCETEQIWYWTLEASYMHIDQDHSFRKGLSYNGYEANQRMILNDWTPRHNAFWISTEITMSSLS